MSPASTGPSEPLPAPEQMAFPPWKWLPPSSRRNYLAAGVVVVFLWVALATLVALPPSSPVVVVPLLYLPVGLVLAVVLLWREVRLARTAMQSRLPVGTSRTEKASPLQSGRGDRTVADYLREAEGIGIKAIKTMTGVDISDHAPERLGRIDAVADERFRATLTRRGEIESASIAFGTYLGEVFVLNLGGRWHYASWLQAVRGSISRDPFRAERDFYILLHGQRVYVFKTARDTIEKTGAVFSLFEFYSGWAKAVGLS